MRPKSGKAIVDKKRGTRKGEGGKGNKSSSAPPFARAAAAAPVQLSVAIVGAGRLGTALGRALAASGYDVSAVVARRRPRALAAARLIATGPEALSARQLDALPPTDLLIIATPDDRLAETAAQLARAFTRRTVRTTKAGGRRPVALHTSGALSSEVLGSLREVGFEVGSMHPLVSVSEPQAGALALRRGYYCVEGDVAAARAARRMVRALGGHSFSVSARDKALYHAAAVMASGHTTALFDIAAQLLVRCGLNSGSARRALLALAGSTLENLSAQIPARALTGPFARADVATVRKHLAAFRERRDDRIVAQALAVYALLGSYSLNLAAANGVDARALAEIARLLTKPR